MRDFPTLENFFSAWFHQDWAVEHDDPGAVVAAYREAEDDERIARARDELQRLLARDLDEDALGAAVRGLGGEYDPTRDGQPWRDWLASVLERLHP